MCRGHRDQLVDEWLDNFTACYSDHHDPTDYRLSDWRAGEVAHLYFAPLARLPDACIFDLVEIMFNSFGELAGRNSIRAWTSCCHGFAEHLLRGCLGGNNQVTAAGVLVRFSRWVHHAPGFLAAFQQVAARMAAPVWGGGGLPYLQIGEEWTFDASRLRPGSMDAEQQMSLWDFASGNTPEAKHEDETRALASRLLNFMCERSYGPVRVRYTFREILAEHVTRSWAVDSPSVDCLSQYMHVHGPGLLQFLQRQRFNPSTMWNPHARRRGWFEGWTFEEG